MRKEEELRKHKKVIADFEERISTKVKRQEKLEVVEE